jgi:hypothetical protein
MGDRPPTAYNRGGRATPRVPRCGPLRVAWPPLIRIGVGKKIKNKIK